MIGNTHWFTFTEVTDRLRVHVTRVDPVDNWVRAPSVKIASVKGSLEKSVLTIGFLKNK